MRSSVIIMDTGMDKVEPRRPLTLSHKDSMVKGSARTTVSKIRFQPFVALKQFLYHISPPILNNIAITLVEGHQAAKNQQMGRVLSFDNIIRSFVYISLGLFLSEFALTPLEIIMLFGFFVARSATIAVKYGYRSQCEMSKFHSETDPEKAAKHLTQNLLSAWINPAYNTVVKLIQLASEHASFKTNVDWFTQQENLKMKITFLGKERCNEVFKILEVETGAFGDGTLCPSLDNIGHKLDECGLQQELFGSIKGATRASGEGQCNLGSMKCTRQDVQYLQVPAGTLVSGLFLQASRGSRLRAIILFWVSIVVILLVILLPMFVRTSTIHWFPDIARNNSITPIHNPKNNDGVAGLAYAFFVIGGVINGLSLFMFVLCSVVDYSRRAKTLEIIRSLLRPTYCQDKKTKGFVVAPPLIDLRINQNIFGMNLMNQTMLFFGKEYLLRLQFVLSYVLLFLLLIVLDTLSRVFLSTEQQIVGRYRAEVPLYLQESVVFGLVVALIFCGIVLASVIFANFANLEPEYFQHAVRCCGCGCGCGCGCCVSHPPLFFSLSFYLNLLLSSFFIDRCTAKP